MIVILVVVVVLVGVGVGVAGSAELGGPLWMSEVERMHGG